MIYTLGCSFTKWYWPTWSDWLQAYVDQQVTNWAYPGHTNAVIYYTLLTKAKHLTPNDSVYIMWTGNNRACEWYDQEWVNQKDCAGFFPETKGELWFGSGQAYQGLYKTHPDYQPSLSEMIIANFDIIFKTQMLLDRTGCRYHMMFWQNPWLDTREQFKPVYTPLWPNKRHISQAENQSAQHLLTIKPVQSLLEQIDWTKFVNRPGDLRDPSTYSGLWEFMLSSKEYILHNHVTDPHPNTLVHHDWLVHKILDTVPQHRNTAITLADHIKNMVIPPWSAAESIKGSSIMLNRYPLNIGSQLD